MKRLIVGVLAVCMVVTMTGCGHKSHLTEKKPKREPESVEENTGEDSSRTLALNLVEERLEELAAELEDREVELDEREASLDEREADLNSREAELTGEEVEETKNNLNADKSWLSTTVDSPAKWHQWVEIASIDVFDSIGVCVNNIYHNKEAEDLIKRSDEFCKFTTDKPAEGYEYSVLELQVDYSNCIMQDYGKTIKFDEFSMVSNMQQQGSAETESPDIQWRYMSLEDITLSADSENKVITSYIMLYAPIDTSFDDFLFSFGTVLGYGYVYCVDKQYL